MRHLGDGRGEKGNLNACWRPMAKTSRIRCDGDCNFDYRRRNSSTDRVEL